MNEARLDELPKTLDEQPTKMSDVTVRFTAVNPANYNISSGVFEMNTVVYHKGNMLNENGERIKAGCSSDTETNRREAPCGFVIVLEIWKIVWYT